MVRHDMVKRRMCRDAKKAAISVSKSVVGAVSSIFPKDAREAVINGSKSVVGADSYPGIVVTAGSSAVPADEPRMSVSEEVATIVGRSTVVTSTEPESPPTAVVDERITTVATVKDLESLAGAVADATLNELSSPTRTNPKTAILTRVDSADALKHGRSWLYQNKKGDWVVEVMEELPSAEGISKSGATSATQIVYPTLTMV